MKQSFHAIWKNKSLFILLLFLEIFFFGIFFYINMNYQTKILESAKTISDYLSKQKLDDASVATNVIQQKNVLGDDPLLISREFNSMKNNFMHYLALSFALFVFFLSAGWALTGYMIYKSSFKKLIHDFLKNIVILCVNLGLIFGFLFLLFDIPLSEAAEASNVFSKFVPFLIFSMILIYFMFISLSLSFKLDLKNIVQRTLSIGIRKIHYVLLVYLINIILFLLSLALFYYSLDSSLIFLFFSVLLFTFSFVFGKIFVMNSVNRLDMDLKLNQ